MFRKQAVHEEDGIYEQWYKEAHDVKDILGLTAFAEKMLNSYEHDYGTACHAVAALAVAAANVGAYAQGLTGFQAQMVTWKFVRQFGASTGAHDGPMRLVMYRHMLYPQYEDEFVGRTISQDTWEWLQAQAKKCMAHRRDANGTVVAHWQSIMEIAARKPPLSIVGRNYRSHTLSQNLFST